MGSIRSKVSVTGALPLEAALVKNADGSAVASPTFADCTFDAASQQWICDTPAPAGTYAVGAQLMRLKGSSPAVTAGSVGAVTVAGGAGAGTGVTRFAALFGGQSGTVGATPKANLTSNEQIATRNLTRQFSNTYVENRATQQLEKLQFGTNHYGGAPTGGDAYDTAFGLELGLADAMELNQPGNRLDIVKYGVGGQPIEFFSKGASSGWYAEFVTGGNRLKARHTAAGIAWAPVLFWFQGESGGSAADWPAKTKQLFDDFTTDGVILPTSRIVVTIPQGSVENNAPAMRANVLSLSSLDSRVEYIDAAQYNLLDAYHLDAVSNVQYGGYDVYNALFGIARSKPSYISAAQSYTTTAADYTAKCGSGSTGATVTKSRQAASYTSKSDSVSLGLAAATQAAKGAIVCGAAGGNAPTTPSLYFSNQNTNGPQNVAGVVMPAVANNRTVAFWVFGDVYGAEPGNNNHCFLDSRTQQSDIPFAYLANRMNETPDGIEALYANGAAINVGTLANLAAIFTGKWVKVVVQFTPALAATSFPLTLMKHFIYGYGISGRLADIRRYSRVWTAAEIADITATMPTDALLARYDFVGVANADTVLPDVSGNGRNAVMATI